MSVDVVEKPGPLQGPEPVHKSPLLSLEGLQESRGARALVGLLSAVVAVVVVYLIVLLFTGHFTNVVKIGAELPAGSNAVPIGAPVQYRNVTVGKVASEGSGPGGVVVVTFDIYPANVAKVPRGVTAQVAPLSIFGNQYVNLVPPATITAAHVQAGDFIRAFGGAPSTSLQGTVTQLYSLLNAIHPADLDTALTAFATALNGQGVNLGQALKDASSYLKVVAPRLPTVQADLRLVDPVTRHLVQATPDLLGILSNSTVTGQTISDQAAQLHNLLAKGTTASGQLAGLLEQIQVGFTSLVNQSGPLLSDVTRNPNELSLTLQGLGQFASAVASAESHGPFLSVSAALPVPNISAGVDAALGYNNPASIAQALGAAVNPPTYTSANCPQYPGASNPYCGAGGSPAAAPVQAASAAPFTPTASSSSSGSTTAATSTASAPAPAAGGPVTPMSQEQQAIQDIATAVNGGRPPASSAVASLLLMSLLSSMASGS